MTEENIRIDIGIDIGYNVKGGVIADRLLVRESVIFPGSPSSLSSVCNFDKVNLHFRPLCEMLSA